MLHACVERFDVTGTVGKILGTKRGLRSFVGSCRLLQYDLALVLFRVQLWLMISANCQKEYLVKFQKKKVFGTWQMFVYVVFLLNWQIFLRRCLSLTEARFPVIHSLCDSWYQFFNCHIRYECSISSTYFLGSNRNTQSTCCIYILHDKLQWPVVLIYV